MNNKQFSEELFVGSNQYRDQEYRSDGGRGHELAGKSVRIAARGRRRRTYEVVPYVTRWNELRQASFACSLNKGQCLQKRAHTIPTNLTNDKSIK